MNFQDRSKDMSLSEFMALVRTESINDNTYTVTFTMKNKVDTTLTIDNCSSEYEANERAFLYLQDLIYKNNKTNNNE